MSMIESSTSRPMQSSSPTSVPLLKVIPSGTIISTAIASEVGSVTIAISLPRHSPRKTSTARPGGRQAGDRVPQHLLGALRAAVDADDRLVRTRRDRAPAAAHVVAIDGVPHVQDREAVGGQLLAVDHHLQLPPVAAERDDGVDRG